MSQILVWFKEVTQGDDDMLQVLRAYLKAIVQGATTIQRILEVVGPGGSGKGTYLRLAQALVGLDNTMVTELKHLETSRFELANVRWKRLICVTDADRYGGPINNLKALTGGDFLRMEEKYVQGRQNRTADGLVLIAANEEVQSSDYTSGLGRRRLTIYFTHVPSVPRDLLSIQGRTFHGEFVARVAGAPDVGAGHARRHDVRPAQPGAPAHHAHLAGALGANAPRHQSHGRVGPWPSRPRCPRDHQGGVAEKIDLTTTHHDPLAQKSTSIRETYYKNEDTWLYPNYVVHMSPGGGKAPGPQAVCGGPARFLGAAIAGQGHYPQGGYLWLTLSWRALTHGPG